jgi:hypothetical protein
MPLPPPSSRYMARRVLLEPSSQIRSKSSRSPAPILSPAHPATSPDSGLSGYFYWRLVGLQ